MEHELASYDTDHGSGLRKVKWLGALSDGYSQATPEFPGLFSSCMIAAFLAAHPQDPTATGAHAWAGCSSSSGFARSHVTQKP